MSEIPGNEPPPSAGEPPALSPGNSVIRFLAEKTGEAPRVSLRDEESATVSSPVIDPSSREKLSVPHGRGNYQLLGEIARGGMGVVLKGQDTDLGRDIAVKVLDARLCERMDVVQRFVEEAQIGGQLQHPGIVPVYELGMMEDERPYFTMKLVKGRTLAALLAARETASSDRGKLLDIFESVCQTMAYAHSRGVIHRDLKPANIMVGAFGEVQVVDWGLAKVLVRGGVADEKRSREAQADRTILETVRSDGSADGSQSLVGSVLGTPAYMPPEQASGQVQKLDERSDVFALGAILCEILTGLPPYTGEPNEILQAAAQADLDGALERLDACEADAVLVKATKQCLMAAPAARPADAGVLAARIHDFVVSNEERAHRAEVEAARAGVKAQEERKARLLTLALGAAVVLIALVGGGGWLWVQNERAAQEQLDAQREQEAAARELALTQDVNAALNEAAVLEGREQWDEAILAVERARALAEGGGAGAGLLETVNASMTELRAGLAAAQEREAFRLDTQRLVAELKKLAQPDEQVEYDEQDELYRATFAAHGIDLDEGELEAAAEQLTRRGLGSEIALVLDAWGEVRRRDDQFDGALRLLELAHIVDPDETRAHLREAMLVGDLDELRYLGGEGLDGDQPASTYALLGSSLARLKEVELSRSVYRAGLEQHPDDYELHFRLALSVGPAPDVQRTEAEVQEAEVHYRAALALDPSSGAVRIGLSRVHARQGQFELALAQIERALELEPENGNYQFRLARLLPSLGRDDEARALLERLVTTTEPAWVSGWSSWALAGMAMTRDDHAEALVRVNAAWDSGVSEGYYIRIGLLHPFAMLTAATGDGEHLVEARKRYDLEFGGMPEGYRRYVRDLIDSTDPFGDPWFPYATTEAGVALVLEEAVDVARTGTRYGPEVADLWWSLGLAKFLQGDPTSALEAWDEQRKLGDSEDPRRWLARALAHHARDEPETARELYDQALAWMAVNPTEDIELLEWLQAEAARALGE
jgi:tetratricopeptide (TPR) repeat protein/tRNA A-37 threonylcarbamoyl transferase component Bud32